MNLSAQRMISGPISPPLPVQDQNCKWVIMIVTGRELGNLQSRYRRTSAAAEGKEQRRVLVIIWSEKRWEGEIIWVSEEEQYSLKKQREKWRVTLLFWLNEKCTCSLWFSMVFFSSHLSACSSSRRLSTLCSPALWWTSSLSSTRALRSSRSWTAPTPPWWASTTDASPRWDNSCYTSH